MGKRLIKVGIIAGTGLDEIVELMVKDNIRIINEHDNLFGSVSSKIVEGTICGVSVALISRHGAGHRINPSQVNYRANIDELKSLGCTHILATTACGSLSENIAPGQLVVPDSFIDRTHGRKGTMFDGTSMHYEGVCHMPMEPAFDPRTSEVLITAARECHIDVKKGGTVVTIEGPRFSSKAESKVFRLWGGDLVNMTICPEVTLAKEAGLLYACLATATDYDSWKDSEARVSVPDVMLVMKDNVGKVVRILTTAIELIGKQDWDQDIADLERVVESAITSSKK